MDNSKQQNQSRFLIAAVLSMVFLFTWSYFSRRRNRRPTMRTRRRSSARQTRRRPEIQQANQTTQPRSDAGQHSESSNYDQIAALRSKARFKRRAGDELGFAERRFSERRKTAVMPTVRPKAKKFRFSDFAESRQRSRNFRFASNRRPNLTNLLNTAIIKLQRPKKRLRSAKDRKGRLILR
jgi:hypothetical protein